jgi:RNA polymerase sigma factor (sigma-70 family)
LSRGKRITLVDTSISLLERLRVLGDTASWDRLVALYTPLIRGWLARYEVQAADLDDLSQEVFSTVLREMPNFRHDLRRGAFRRWLRTIAVNRLRNFWRARGRVIVGGHDLESVLDQLEDPKNELSRLWDEEHDRQVARRLLELLGPEFEPTTWAAFKQLVLDGAKTQEVAESLGISANAVRIAKSRVLSRFRKEVDGLID